MVPSTVLPADSGPEGADGDEPPEVTEVGGRVTRRAAPDIAAGAVLADRYQIEATLGEGGSGTVYRAWDRILAEAVAVKILHAHRARERSWIRRLAREVKVARAVGHPNVCRVFELGHADGRWFVTMELATGGSLRDQIGGPENAAGRPLPERLRDIRELAAGLAAMHAVALTHRDVTPRNVLRMADGRLVLTDFGLSIEHDAHTTVHGGTPAYLPPEAARGERSDQRSDVFQLGMIIHEILTGVRPAWAPDGSRLVVADPPPGASPAEEELARLVSDCVSVDPARRPVSAVAVAGRLAAAEVARPLPLPLRLLARARRFSRRHPRLLVVAASAVALAGVVRAVQVASRPPLCQGAEQQLAGIWDPARTEAVRRAFMASGKGYAGESFSRVRAVLDQYGQAWTRMYTDACEATHRRGEQSAEVLDLRMGCLKDDQGELRALTDLFSSADGEVVSRSMNAVAALSPIGRCADVAILKAVVRPPEDHAARVRVDAIRQQLSEVKALHFGGQLAEASRRASALVGESRALGYEPLLAEALQAQGRTQTMSGPFLEAEAALDEALLRAEASRHDRVLAEAAVDRTALLGVQGRVDELGRFVPRAEATLKRIGGDRRLEGWIYANLGTALFYKGRVQEALAMQEKALDIKQRLLGAEHWDVALSLGSVASYLHSLGREDEALERNQQAITVLERTLGAGHPELALHLNNRGEIRLALGQPREARADFERALAMWKDELPADHLYLSYSLTGVGLAVLALVDEGSGGAGDAVEPLERAYRIRNGTGAAPELRAETAFALARALWKAGPDAGRDRARAVALGNEALRSFPADKAAERAQVSETLHAWHAVAQSQGTGRAATSTTR